MRSPGKGERARTDHRDIEECRHDRRKGNNGDRIKNPPVHAVRIDHFLAQHLDEVGKRLVKRRPDPLLHTCSDLPVKVREEEGVRKQKQKSREHEDVEEDEHGIDHGLPLHSPAPGITGKTHLRRICYCRPGFLVYHDHAAGAREAGIDSRNNHRYIRKVLVNKAHCH